MLELGFLGLGEAGSLIAADLAAAGARVRGWDPGVDAVAGVEIGRSPGEVAAGADAVVSLNSAEHALEAARSVASDLRPGQLFADFNTASPARKLEVAAVIAPTGAAFVDVALLRAVPGRGLRTRALASGPGATRFAELFGTFGMPVEVVGADPGLAASRKLARSVFLKGMAAAAEEALAAARELGCESWLYHDLEQTLDSADGTMLRRLVEGSRVHAVRRSAEMAAASEMLEALGVAPRIASASAAWLRELAARPGPGSPDRT